MIVEFNWLLIIDHQPSGDGYHDYQEIKLQEHVQRLGVGYVSQRYEERVALVVQIPRSVWVLLEKDLVDTCKAGDDVTVTGIVRQRWKPLRSVLVRE